MIITDTREQLCLFSKEKTIKQKLDVGDYTTTDLLGILHIERKSPNDLYGSIIQGHDRFRAEILRAAETGVDLEIWVECTEKEFYAKKWDKTRKLKVKGNILAKIIHTMKKKYNLKFVWCNGREDMEKKMKEKWQNYKKLKEKTEQ